MSKKQNKLIFMACCTVLLLSTGSANAIGLKFSNPQPHQKIKAGNQEIHLIYDHEFDPFRSRLLLINQSGQPDLIPATTALNHREVKTSYPLKAGQYILQWHVWNWKGEESTGEIPFEAVNP